ncbi:hypothetical protein AGABI1DRAFT_103055 [Agaricus bisporus var. burnettii JB137-S8]|uniref:Uncharacterized protein n=1 Tax=Agaricus bisporus var. burnettii (strain JB137-S8 / ATCC MYA-4627 / FGSC 10392) TaxID=597362 RepID=K5WX92_AGABU|nr:uncharacterized protein AGABI1DRAFT_103055 [Agaricus bisporus var. burnettii JB137-S8]EKM75192.1 hypothetical protein AGABI1DRAFT_103055 [Agaricus bisporus var. burnettii JB137-S8]
MLQTHSIESGLRESTKDVDDLPVKLNQHNTGSMTTIRTYLVPLQTTHKRHIWRSTWIAAVKLSTTAKQTRPTAIAGWVRKVEYSYSYGPPGNSECLIYAS